MLQYKNNNLTIESEITSADSIIKLISDINAVFIGILTLSNGTNKVLNFIKENNLYKTRLLITEEDLPYLNSCSLYLSLVSGTLSGNTNKVNIKFNVPKIKQTIKVSSSNDIKDLKISLTQLEARITELLTKTPGFIVRNLETANSNYIKPGMIPVAIDETGKTIFQYPFIDHVTEINGQKTVNSAILLTAKDIPIEQTDVESAIKAHTEALKELNNFMKTISEELKVTKNKVAEIEKALIQHTDSSII